MGERVWGQPVVVIWYHVRMSIERHLVLQGIVGSTAYGLAHEGSDVDRLGVFQFPTVHILGRLGKGECSEDTLVEADPLPDRQIHEVAKYMRLASVANPTALELLWLDTYEVIEGAGHILVANRDLFLSQRVRGTYIGYAKAQASRLMKRQAAGHKGFMSKKSTEKHGRHCARLLYQGHDLLATGNLTVKLTEEQATKVRHIGLLAEENPGAFLAVMDSMVEAMNEVESVLPEEPDTDAISALLVRIRLGHDVGS